MMIIIYVDSATEEIRERLKQVYAGIRGLGARSIVRTWQTSETTGGGVSRGHVTSGHINIIYNKLFVFTENIFHSSQRISWLRILASL
jgi:hypothetical protein